MAMTGRLKLGLIAFVLFDLLLAATFITLYLIQTERKDAQELRDLGLTIYPEARDVNAFTLMDEHGSPFSETDFTEYWNFVFFGFTSCPDICPLTMAELKQFYSGLAPADQAKARIIMVSVDPDRDNPAALGAYVDSFHEDFIGLTGDSDAIANLAAQFFVAHSEPKPVTAIHENHNQEIEEEYLIEHSGHLAIVDPNGKFVAVMRSPVRDKDLAVAYQALLSN